ncbi:MAG: HaeIII family restriction endonuclease [Cellvibrionales bacterium]|nr:HaeIII family restriction endonuclease [Cellvibrionales bacterium]
MGKQVINGLGFEYAIAHALNRILHCGIAQNTAAKKCATAYRAMDKNIRIKADVSAEKIAAFLLQCDKRLNHAVTISIQGSAEGRTGDVRDVLIDCVDSEIGISAKHRHYDVKHPRLSSKIDFGKQWGDQPVSDTYWRRVKPIFEDLQERRLRGEKWRNIPNKQGTIYLPLLIAFQDELERLCADYGRQFIPRFFHYLIGRNDFYKAICDTHESVVESINLNGTLAWGDKWKIPDRIQSVNRATNSETILIVTFEGGWQISFRLHSASSKVEPSLKFAVSFIGVSSKVSRITLSHDD